MARYRPTAEEQAAIDRLALAGYAVVRQRTYDDLKEKVVLAGHREQWLEEDTEHARAWARSAFDEQQRLFDRLNQLCAVAAAHGVPIEAMNDVLARTQPASVKAAIHNALTDVRWRVMRHEAREDERSPYVPSNDAQREFVEALTNLEGPA